MGSVEREAGAERAELLALRTEVEKMRAQHAERDAAERVHVSAYAGSVARREAAEAERDALRAHLCTVLGWAYDVCDQTIQCPQCNAVWWNQPEAINENWHGPGCEIFAAEVASGRSVDVRRGPACEEKLRAVIAEEEGYKDHLRAMHAEAVANEAMAVGLAEVGRLRTALDALRARNVVAESAGVFARFAAQGERDADAVQFAATAAERDNLRAEVERLRAVLRDVAETLRVLPPAFRASYWYIATMDAICGALTPGGAA